MHLKVMATILTATDSRTLGNNITNSIWKLESTRSISKTSKQKVV